MLYATTRNNVDTFTAQWVLTRKRAPDGGLFVPYRLPAFSEKEIQALGQKRFNANLADTLNLLFGSHLTAYDLDFSLGHQSVRLQQLGQKIIMGECWHNTQWSFSAMVRDISRLLLTEPGAEPETRGWAQIGVRIAVLFGIFGELLRCNMASDAQKVDISLVSGDFSGPMSCWYAREMGLPIGNIVCCCNENGTLWDFLCHGQLRTDGVAKQTMVPQADVVVPEALEQLISIFGGSAEAERYVQCIHEGRTYYAEDGLLQRMSKGLYATVSSQRRVQNTIPNTWATHHYLLAPSGALAYAGLLDYRARTGEMRSCLILTERSPRLDGAVITSAMDISQQELEKYL